MKTTLQLTSFRRFNALGSQQQKWW